MSGDNMGGVKITNNKKKETAWIDTEGNILDIEASQTGLKVNGIKEKNDGGYKPTKEEIEKVINLPKEVFKVPEGLTVENAAKLADPVAKTPETKLEEPKTSSPMADLIKKQIQEAVMSSIKEINIKEIVNETIKEALK